MHHYRFLHGTIDEDAGEFRIELLNGVSNETLTVTGKVSEIFTTQGIKTMTDPDPHLRILGETIAGAMNEATRGEIGGLA